MSCFTMEYLGFHQIAYAHALAVEDYSFSFTTAGFGSYRARESETSGVIEIGYVVENPLVIENHTLAESYTALEGDIFIFPPGHDVSVHAQKPGPHQHITSEYMIDARVEIHGGRFPADIPPVSGSSITLPYILPADPANRAATKLIHKVAADHTLLITKSRFKQISEFCSLLEALRRLSDPVERDRAYISPSYRANCKKAEEFIEANITRRIKIDEIARAVGISKNYLINIFSKYKGMGLSEYINRVKLNRLLLMMTRYGYSMKQSCEALGYDDVNYVSRIFSKYYGVPLREYCRMTLSAQPPSGSELPGAGK